MRITAFIPYNRHKVGNCQRLLNMQIAFPSVLSYPSVIIHTVGDIGVLLNLRNQDILSDGVERAGFDEQHIPLLHRDCVQHLKQRVFPDAAFKLGGTDFLAKSVIQKRILPGIHDIPHFCFPILSLMRQRIPVIRMHLNGQVILCVNELDQNGEIPEPSAMRP